MHWKFIYRTIEKLKQNIDWHSETVRLIDEATD